MFYVFCIATTGKYIKVLMKRVDVQYQGEAVECILSQSTCLFYTGSSAVTVISTTTVWLGEMGSIVEREDPSMGMAHED